MFATIIPNPFRRGGEDYVKLYERTPSHPLEAKPWCIYVGEKTLGKFRPFVGAKAGRYRYRHPTTACSRVFPGEVTAVAEQGSTNYIYTCVFEIHLRINHRILIEDLNNAALALGDDKHFAIAPSERTKPFYKWRPMRPPLLLSTRRTEPAPSLPSWLGVASADPQQRVAYRNLTISCPQRSGLGSQTSVDSPVEELANSLMMEINAALDAKIAGNNAPRKPRLAPLPKPAVPPSVQTGFSLEL